MLHVSCGVCVPLICLLILGHDISTASSARILILKPVEDYNVLIKRVLLSAVEQPQPISLDLIPELSLEPDFIDSQPLNDVVPDLSPVGVEEFLVDAASGGLDQEYQLRPDISEVIDSQDALDGERADVISGDVVAKRGQLEVPYLPEPRPLMGSRANKRAPVSGVSPDGVQTGDLVFVSIVFVCTASAMFGIVAAGVWWKKVHENYKAAEPADYGEEIGSSRGSLSDTGAFPSFMASVEEKYKSWSGGRKSTTLQEPAIFLQSADECGSIRLSVDSCCSDDAANDESVYECPGLAATSDVEVSNPMFRSNSLDEDKMLMRLPMPASQDRRTSAPPTVMQTSVNQMTSSSPKR